ncbi:MAG: FG-GAP repeat protein, partial [Planctomycetota bacterium]
MTRRSIRTRIAPPAACIGLIASLPLSPASTAGQAHAQATFDQKLLAPDGAANDYFGHSVAVSGTTALVGSHLDNDNGTYSGSAYLFDTTTGDLISKLTAPDAAAFDYFGRSVAVSGTTALVGSAFDDDNVINSGSAYLFDTTTGDLISKLTAPDGAGNDRFGNSVAVSGTTALVGSYLDNDNGALS